MVLRLGVKTPNGVSAPGVGNAVAEVGLEARIGVAGRIPQ